MGLPDDDQHRQVFLDNLVSGNDAHLPLAPGIALLPIKAGTLRGLALQIAPEALQAGQLQNVLERRFEHALAFHGCFVYQDARGVLVIWHALPTPPGSGAALNDTVSRMLSLARLEALDVHRTH
ncbi:MULTISPECIES: transcriptional regulator [unclassified Pseudomonas]|uniref:transcriptional regulator n=1 Tax=unclassified Pseudomonas TaxID=196821 RepID=UPI0015A4576C|nr:MULTISPECIES: transcriptional regulator [unclassified Pseudomonas]NWC93852.1 transcriptional regulator [Pseudomonas sp. IPO3779]NWD16174.1 transcriptional regulator [Pseudomonas sp. IPO3778]